MSEYLAQFLGFLDSSSRSSALPDVVPFLVREFRQMWAVTGQQEGQTALAYFLFALHATDAPLGVLQDPAWRKQAIIELGMDDLESAEGEFSPEILEQAAGLRDRSPMSLRLVPSLVLRHAAGRLFQEAHAILDSVQPGLFGEHFISTTATYSPSGAYFTPVPIARLLADWALQRWRVFPDEITVADYACGSAVFLTEVLRALERHQFNGTVRLVGRDKSPHAITMAKVAVRALAHDMSKMNVVSDIAQSDAIDSEWAAADIILMNPPFRSWERMDSREREWVSGVTKGVSGGKPDLSVGFVERAVGVLKPGGALATLVPSGILSSSGLAKWRDSLLQRATPDLIAVLGEHGLFQHALVNVGIIALRNGPLDRSTPLRVAWSSADDGAASGAIRAIRRSIVNTSAQLSSPEDVGRWSVAITDVESFKRKHSWLPGAGTLGPLLDSIQATADTNIGDLFHVHEGIKTGAKEILVQPANVVACLPPNERRFFKKAVDSNNFIRGEIEPNSFLFVGSARWLEESDVKGAVPDFFNKYLKPNQQILQDRKDHAPHWWALTRKRTWVEGRPRLLSKKFGLYPAFGRDPHGQFAPVQAHVWEPMDSLSVGLRDDDALRELLTTYWWLLNSRVAVALLREFCPNVAGGQLDLARKYVKNAPMPNLRKQFQQNPALQEIASRIRVVSGNDLPTLSDRDQFAAAAFGTELSAWNLAGLDSSF